MKSGQIVTYKGELFAVIMPDSNTCSLIQEDLFIPYNMMGLSPVGELHFTEGAPGKTYILFGDSGEIVGHMNIPYTDLTVTDRKLEYRYEPVADLF